MLERTQHLLREVAPQRPPGRNRNPLIILRFTPSRSNPLFSRVRASQAGLLEQWIETTFHGRLNPYWLDTSLMHHNISYTSSRFRTGMGSQMGPLWRYRKPLGRVRDRSIEGIVGAKSQATSGGAVKEPGNGR